MYLCVVLNTSTVSIYLQDGDPSEDSDNAGTSYNTEVISQHS